MSANRPLGPSNSKQFTVGGSGTNERGFQLVKTKNGNQLNIESFSRWDPKLGQLKSIIPFLAIRPAGRTASRAPFHLKMLLKPYVS